MQQGVPHAHQGGQGNESDGCTVLATICSWVLIIVTFPFSMCFVFKIVREFERVVVFRLGRVIYKDAKGPGMLFYIPCLEHLVNVDLRTMTCDIPPQEVLTKDSVSVTVDAVVYYRIYNANYSITTVSNAAHSTQLLAQTTLRNMLGTKTLAEILSERDSIAHYMQVTLDEATDPWGVKVERVEVKNLFIPQALQRSMASEAEATREASAKVISAEGEEKASQALKDAADIIIQSPAAMQLRYLQTITNVSQEKNETFIFPIPMDLLRQFCGGRQGFQT